MYIKQLSVFVENKFGRVAAIVDTLGKNNIDISALSLADASEFGILRLIVDKPDEAKTLLREQGVIVKVTDVLGVKIEDRPGGLSDILSVLKEEGVTIEYMYAFVGKNTDGASVVFKTNNDEKAYEVFKMNGIRVI